MNGDAISATRAADFGHTRPSRQAAANDDTPLPRQFLARILGHSYDPIVLTDHCGVIQIANQAFGKLIGISETQVAGKNLAALEISPPGRSAPDLGQMLRAQRPWRGDVTLRHADGTPLSLIARMEPTNPERPNASGMVLSFTQSARPPRMTPRVQFRSHQDSLTGLHNRAYFQVGFSRHLTLARRSESQMAVFYLDLNNFKRINDRLGHAAGDMVLQEAARRLAATLGPQRLLARLGGDEFAAVLPYAGAATAIQTAEAILFAFQQPMLIREVQYQLSTSIGIALYPTHGVDAPSLLEKADEAMYEAKAMGGNRWQCYEPEARAKLQRRNKIVEAMAKPDFAQGLTLNFEPLFDSRDAEQARSLEVTLEWHSDELGKVSEAEMRQIAEQSGQIQPFDLRLHQRVLQQYKQWPSIGREAQPIHFTLSYRSLLEPNFVEGFLLRNRSAGVPEHLLNIALSEAELIENSADLIEPLQALRRAGIAVMMTEVDLGKATLQDLIRLPLGLLKIAPALIESAKEQQEKSALIHAISTTGAALDMHVVAAGAPDHARYAWLRAAL